MFRHCKDSEVKQGLKKRGERKEGENMHVQIIISRKDATNAIKLSPLNNSRGSNARHSVKIGQFDRSAFKMSGEFLFDRKFVFDRGMTETFKFANVQKRADLQGRVSFSAEIDNPYKVQQLNIEQGANQNEQLAKSLFEVLLVSDTTSIQAELTPNAKK